MVWLAVAAGVEREALETLFKRGLLERAPDGKGFVRRRPSGAP